MTARRIAPLLVCLWIAPALAQQPRDVLMGQRTGTASIAGLITDNESPPKPLRRARVMLNGSALDVGRTAITNDDGSFLFDRLAPGRYTVSATKEGYVTMAHGAKRPNRPGPSISLRAAENVRISLELPRGAVITGTILDPEGLPAQGVRVQALAYRYMRGPDERRLAPEGTAAPPTTDDRGVFRIFGLPPGDYVVGALPHAAAAGELQVLSDSELRRALSEVSAAQRAAAARPGPQARPTPLPAAPPDRRRSLSMVPVYFPGTPMLARAKIVTLATGEERSGVDFQLQYVPMSMVEGTVSFPPGATSGASLLLIANERNGPSEATRSGRAGPDGRFSIRGVPPGDYALIARAAMPATRSTQPAMLFASTELQVDGDNAPEVFLNLQPGVTISGTIVLEGASPLAGPLPPVRLNTPLLQSGSNAAFAIPPVEIDADGRFTVSALPPGSYRMIANLQGVRAPIAGWWLQSFVVDGKDLLDTGLQFRQSVTNAVITFSRHASVLSGTVTNEAANAAPDTYVIVFSTDRSTWFANSRRIMAERTSEAGRFTIRNLPPGGYYILAEDDVEPGEWFDPLFLEQLVPRAARLTLAANEQKTHDITVGAR